MELASILDFLTDDEKKEVNSLLFESTPLWVPLPGPQTDAYYSPADILYYGGAAGGGKTDLVLGLAATAHIKSIVYRRENTQNLPLINRLLDDILKTRKGWNGQDHIWRDLDGGRRHITFGACKDVGDENRYQGHAHDLKAFDEISHFQESQFRFLCGWLRSPDPNQRKRIVCTGNPPTNQDGQWIVKYWGPWLDETYPNPAQPGELRWFTTIDGKDREFPTGDPFVYQGRWIKPLSRTFIPSKVTDNVFMVASGYEAMLQALPEPLRSQMLLGDFKAGVEDSVWQVIPTAWVEAAMARWTPDDKRGEMSSCGVDVARGGKDSTIIATRYGKWHAPIYSYPGKQTPDGGYVAGLVVTCIRDAAPVHVDVIGVGASVLDHLNSNDVQVVGINGSESATHGAVDKASKTLKFRNKRAELWWRFRESLDPKTGDGISLPPDPQLKADLCTPLWKLAPSGIQIESKDDIIKRLGHSPDRADAVIYCSVNTFKRKLIRNMFLHQEEVNDYDPLMHGLRN